MKEPLIYVDRRGTNCYKWDSVKEDYCGEPLLPMSIADLDFKTPECVRNALKEYVDMGALGYYQPSDEYYEAFLRWEKEYYKNELRKEWIRYAPGVVVAISWLLEVLTEPGEAGMILTPVYAPFSEMLRQNQLALVCSPLLNHQGTYSIDFEDFEQKIVSHRVRVFILCSPHNPIGRVWREEELEKMVSICKRHHVFIISDEIHHDIVMSGHKHVPTFNVGDYREHMVMLTSAAKSFNLAGIENSFMVIPGEKVRMKIDALQDRIATHSGNGPGYAAVTAAYTYGRPWLNELCGMIEDNYIYTRDRLLSALPKLQISNMEGTFLMWIGFQEYLGPDDDISKIMACECGLAVNAGETFGGKDYKDYIRMNIGTSRENIDCALYRIIRYFRDKG